MRGRPHPAPGRAHRTRERAGGHTSLQLHAPLPAPAPPIVCPRAPSLYPNLSPGRAVLLQLLAPGRLPRERADWKAFYLFSSSSRAGTPDFGASHSTALQIPGCLLICPGTPLSSAPFSLPAAPQSLKDFGLRLQQTLDIPKPFSILLFCAPNHSNAWHFPSTALPLSPEPPHH